MNDKTAQDEFRPFVEDLRSTHGDNLASVVLYGAAAAGDQTRLRSDYNLLIALDRITPADLRSAQAPMREWQRLGHPLPVYFTIAELRDAADTFPIEFHQMKRARSILYGADPFEAIQISDRNLRHQTEYELRSKLIQLRSLYIPASASGKQLCALMSDSLMSFATLFASVLRLSGVEPPVLKRDCVRTAAQHLRLDREPFERIFELTEKGVQNSNVAAANDLFAAYVLQIELVIEAIDRTQSDQSGFP